MIHTAPEELRAADLARAALAQVGADPRAAVAAATEAVAAARREDDRAAESTARRALGLAREKTGDLPGALTELQAAVRVASRGGLPEHVAEARMSLAFVLLDRGRIAGALRQVDTAEAALHGVARARVRAQGALIRQRCGRLEEALEDYRRALPVLQRAGDGMWEARLRNNRGLLHAYRGALPAAESDLRAAAELYRSLGQDIMAADTEWNLGFVAARRGDIPGALERYDQKQLAYDQSGIPLPERLLDRAEVLLSAGLAEEALESAGRAVEEFARLGRETDLAEAQLLQAQSALLAGEAAAAKTLADEAASHFKRQQREGWRLAAQYVSLRAAVESNDAAPPGAETYRRARRTADALSTHGWHVLAMDARIIAAKAALSIGNVKAAEAQLKETTGARRRGTVEMRLRAWHAEALLRSATGRRTSVEPALRAGLRALDDYRASLGATELRVRAAGHGGELAALGLSMALEDGDPRRALAWTEQWRAGTVRLRPVRPPSDTVLAESLAELRRVSAEAEQALLEGQPAGRLRARQATLEREIQAASRRVQASSAVAHSAVGAEELLSQLKSRVLISYFALEGSLRALTLVDGEVVMHELGGTDEPARLLDMLHFSLRRLASGSGSPASLAAARATAIRGAKQLDDVLLAPLRGRLDDRPTVVVPTAALHGVPWGLLPTSWRVPIVVAPSGTVWLRADASPALGTGGPGLLVSGPRLDAAEHEVSSVAAVHPDAVTLTGESATVERVSSALQSAEWAHMATHGRLRSDNPLFSSLELSDGSLTVYDLETLARVPSLVALPACQSGIGSVRAGEEVLGLATALLSLGTRTLVATVIPVPDFASRTLMVAMHDRLAAGDSTSVALWRARTALDPLDPADFAAAAGFVCLGAG